MIDPSLPDVPACWDWPAGRPPYRPLPGLELLGPLPDWALAATGPDSPMAHAQMLREWQSGRCAVCGDDRQELVEDHDHDSGLTRGYLCRSCNLGEGVHRSPVFDLYRERYPTLILGLTIPYSGWGWADGKRIAPDPPGPGNATAGIGL